MIFTTHFKQKEDEEFVIFEVPGEELEGVLEVARGEEHLRLGDQSLWIVAVLQILSSNFFSGGDVIKIVYYQKRRF